MLFDSAVVVQQGFSGTGIEGQDITLRTVIVVVDPNGPIPMDYQRATTERLIAVLTQANCRPHHKDFIKTSCCSGGTIEHFGGKNSQGFANVLSPKTTTSIERRCTVLSRSRHGP